MLELDLQEALLVNQILEGEPTVFQRHAVPPTATVHSCLIGHRKAYSCKPADPDGSGEMCC
eukprot:838600-Rhodomonas_salina.1